MQWSGDKNSSPSMIQSSGIRWEDDLMMHQAQGMLEMYANSERLSIWFCYVFWLRAVFKELENRRGLAVIFCLTPLTEDAKVCGRSIFALEMGWGEWFRPHLDANLYCATCTKTVLKLTLYGCLLCKSHLLKRYVYWGKGCAVVTPLWKEQRKMYYARESNFWHLCRLGTKRVHLRMRASKHI